MKRCATCRSELTDTALRCGRCRKPVAASVPATTKNPSLEKISDFNQHFKENVPPSRGILPALFFVGFVFALAYLLESSGAGVAIVAALKRRYFVFTQEPVLVWQVYVFLQTFGLKLAISLLLIIYLAAIGERPMRALGLDRSGQLDRRVYPAFMIFSAIIGISSGLDPLTPAFPMHSFFGEALVWGNIAAIFSMLVVAPVAEELFFRGFLYPAFSRSLGAAGSVLVTSILFAAAHWRPDVEWSTLAIIFTGSIGITLVRVLTGSTRASIRLHTLYNTTLLAAGLLRYAILGY